MDDINIGQLVEHTRDILPEQNTDTGLFLSHQIDASHNQLDKTAMKPIKSLIRLTRRSIICSTQLLIQLKRLIVPIYRKAESTNNGKIQEMRRTKIRNPNQQSTITNPNQPSAIPSPNQP